MPRQLVVNADDLGLTAGINDGIFDAHDRGIVTSASLFANAPATVDAIARVRAHPSLGIGCHLALADGRPTLPPHRVPTLVGGDGRFRPSWRAFISACVARRVSLVEVEQELTAQIDRLRSEDIPLTHVDGHKHLHAYPPVFAIVARLARRFGMASVRVPLERGGRRLPCGRSWTVVRQRALNLAMWPLARLDYRIAASHGLRTPHVAGRIHTGGLDACVLDAILRALPAGVSELIVHPGHTDAALDRVATRLRASRQDEARLLCDDRVAATLAAAQIDLVRHDLAGCVGGRTRHGS